MIVTAITVILVCCGHDIVHALVVATVASLTTLQAEPPFMVTNTVLPMRSSDDAILRVMTSPALASVVVGLLDAMVAVDIVGAVVSTTTGLPDAATTALPALPARSE